MTHESLRCPGWHSLDFDLFGIEVFYCKLLVIAHSSFHVFFQKTIVPITWRLFSKPFIRKCTWLKIGHFQTGIVLRGRILHSRIRHRLYRGIKRRKYIIIKDMASLMLPHHRCLSSYWPIQCLTKGDVFLSTYVWSWVFINSLSTLIFHIIKLFLIIINIY